MDRIPSRYIGASFSLKVEGITPATRWMSLEDVMQTDTSQIRRTHAGTHSHEALGSHDDMCRNPLARGPGVLRLMDTE